METRCQASLPIPHKPQPHCLLSLAPNRLQNNPDENTIRVYIYHSETVMSEGMFPESKDGVLSTRVYSVFLGSSKMSE